MGLRLKALAGIAALLLAGAAAEARAAETMRPTPAPAQFANETQQPWSAPVPRKSLQFDTKGRWGLRLDMDQPSNRDTQWKDVQAGAYFRITPSLRIGGSVALTDNKAAPDKVTPQDGTPRVHLETAFRF